MVQFSDLLQPNNAGYCAEIIETAYFNHVIFQIFHVKSVKYKYNINYVLEINGKCTFPYFWEYDVFASYSDCTLPVRQKLDSQSWVSSDAVLT